MALQEENLNQVFNLHNCCIFSKSNVIKNSTGEQHLEPKAMQVLLVLAEQPNTVLTRQFIIEKVWPNSYSGDEALSRCISLLRSALGEKKSGLKFINTISKTGYCLVAPLTYSTCDEKNVADNKVKKIPQQPKKIIFTLVLLGMTAIIAVTEFYYKTDTQLISKVNASIAVLPFVDMSPNKDHEYFADGLAEELLNVLTKNRQLKVIARTSSFSFKSKNLTIREIAEQLNVAYVLEGSVRKSGNYFKITAQLIDAETEQHLWSETYVRQMKDIFIIQNEISKAIFSALEREIPIESLSSVHVTQMINIEAFDLYLKGLQSYHQGTTNSFIVAKGYFERAIELEPNYAEAWYRLSRTLYRLLEPFNLRKGALTSKSTYTDLQATEEAALKAIELNPNLGGAHTVLSIIYPWDKNKTPELRLKALSLSPNDEFVVYQYGRALEWIQQPEEADKFLNRALKLDPLNLESQTNYGVFNTWRGRTEKGRKIFDGILESNPDYAFAWEEKSRNDVFRGDLVSAVTSSLRAMELDPSKTHLKARIFYCYLAMEDLKQAKYWLDSLRNDNFNDFYSYKSHYLWLKVNGQQEEAIQLLRQQLEEGSDTDKFELLLINELLALGHDEEAKSLILEHGGEKLEAYVDYFENKTGPMPKFVPLYKERANAFHFIYSKTDKENISKEILKYLRFDNIDNNLGNLEHTGDDYWVNARKLMREGKHEQALISLETAVELGLRCNNQNDDWNFHSVWQIQLRDYYWFKDISNHPRFIALIKVIKEDMAKQRVELAERLNKVEFPNPIQLSSRSITWVSSDVK